MNKSKQSIEKKMEIKVKSKKVKSKKVKMEIKNISKINEDGLWSLVDSYFSENSNILIKHHYDSFDNFITNDIPNIIENREPVTIKSLFDENKEDYNIKYKFSFSNTVMTKPTYKESDGKTLYMYPNIARLRGFTYSSDLYVDIKHSLIKNGEEKILPTLSRVFIGKIPIMLKSKFCILSDISNNSLPEMDECEYEQGGYFIIKGSEKVIVCQERKLENNIYMFKKPDHTVEIKSIVNNKLSHLIEIKYMKNSGLIKVRIAGTFKKEVPIFILFRALGIESDKDIIEHILLNVGETTDKKTASMLELLRPSLEDSNFIKTQEIAFEYLSNYMSSYLHNSSIKITDVLEKKFLNHLGISFKKKALFLGMMTKKVLELFLGFEKYDDRDSFINKRIHTSGMLLSQLFMNNFEKMIKDLSNGIEKDIRLNYLTNIELTIQKNLKPATITEGLKYALATGNWGLKTQSYAIVQKGIAQVLGRLSYSQTLSHLRRVNAPVARKGNKNKAPHSLHSTSYGFICPVETPEGENVGLLKQLAYLTVITTEISDAPIREQILKLKHRLFEDIEPSDLLYNTPIYINGDLYCITDVPNDIITELRSLKRKCILNIYISISWNIKKNKIEIYTDGGRMTRPLFVVENNNILFTNKMAQDIKNGILKWDDLVYTGVIEYLDVQEIDSSMLAMSQADLIKNKKTNKFFYKYTHCEIQISMLLGPLASTIPFINCNQAPRNIYYTSQGKQAIGINAMNFRHRMDTSANILNYPQKPLVTTKASKYSHIYDLPSGQNAIVAIMCYTGYNQEDSLIFNQSAIDRGLFTSSYYRMYKNSQQKNQSSLEDEKFCVPVKYNENGTLQTLGMKPGSYEHLDENGFAKVGSVLKGGDVIIGKTIPIKNKSQLTASYKDNSTALKNSDSGVIDKVYVNEDGDGYEFCKIRVREERIPIIGDKFTSRVAQKGTIGITYPQEDMPFTKDGISPDIILNPHAIPSRMTIGQLLETLFGKAAAIGGFEADATPFREIKSEDMADILQDLGFERNGYEILYNGKTGEQIKADIFIGPTYYQRLKHMVLDKIHSRTTGPTQHLTRQPTDGRTRSGGLRIGEMERDCFLSHGTANFLKERFFDCSDKYFVYVCVKCGLIAVANPDKNIFKCTYCPTSNDFKKVNIPYAMKLMIQELMAMSIAPRIRV
jgi:DNA-directed RNA polymerase II subunit RPB2